MSPRAVINGVDISDSLQGWDLSMGFFDTAWSLSLQVYGLPFSATKPLSKVEFYLGENQLFLGYIWNRGTDAFGSQTLSCEDYRSRYVRSYADPKLTVNKGETMQKAIGRILQPFGISEIVSGTQTWKNVACIDGKPSGHGGVDLNTKTEARSPKENQGAFQLAQTYLERMGAVLFPADDWSKVALAAPSYGQTPTFAVQRTPTDSNVQSAEMTEDYGEIMSIYVGLSRGFSTPGEQAKGLKKDVSPFGEESPLELPDRVLEIGKVITEGRVVNEVLDTLYIPRFVHSRECKTQQEQDHLLHREISNAFRNTLALTYSFDDVHQNGCPFVPDSVFSVQDDLFEVQGDFWCINSRLSYSEGRGPSAQVQLIFPGSYVL